MWKRRRVSFTALLAVFMVLAFGGAAHAQGSAGRTVVVLDPAAEGFDAQTSRAVAELIGSEFTSRGWSARVMHERVCADKACRDALRAEQSANMVVSGRLIKLGERAILTVEIDEGTAVRNERVSADGVGEFDRLIPRLVDAIISGRSYEASQTVSTVSEAEQKEYRRVTGDFSNGPGLAFLVPIGGSYGGEVPYLLGVGYPLRYEIDKLGFEFRLGLLFDSAASETDHAFEFPMDLNAMYYFSEAANSAFVGGGIGLHYLHVSRDLSDEEIDDNDTDIFNGRVQAAATGNKGYVEERLEDESWNQWAPAANAFVGYEFLRTHTFHADVRVGYQALFVKLDGQGAHGAFLNAHFTFGHER